MRNSESEGTGRKFDELDFDSLEDVHNIISIIKEKPLKAFKRDNLIYCVNCTPIAAEKGSYAHSVHVIDFCDSCSSSFKVVAETKKSQSKEAMSIDDFSMAHGLAYAYRRKSKCYKCMLADGDTILNNKK